MAYRDHDALQRKVERIVWRLAGAAVLLIGGIVVYQLMTGNPI